MKYPPLFHNKNILQIFESANKQEVKLIKSLQRIASIYSPTFHERDKVNYLHEMLKDLGIQSKIDKQGNLYGEFKTQSKTAAYLLVIAHVDTVLTPSKKVKNTTDYLYGHGVCDNSTGVNTLYWILKFIKEFSISLPVHLIFSFTVQEEGLGVKGGMRFLLTHVPKPIAVLNLESHNLGRIVHECPGQYRIKLLVETSPGGHSFRDFGSPNAIVVTSYIIGQLAKIKGFEKKQTTYNIGKITGGNGINAIATSCECTLEIRALVQRKLGKYINAFEKILFDLERQFKGVKITKTILAQTTAVVTSPSERIYQMTEEVQSYLGIKTFFEMGNNDGDVPLALGIPTVTIGSSNGFKTHSQDEYVEKKTLLLGFKQNLLTLLYLAHNYQS